MATQLSKSKKLAMKLSARSLLPKSEVFFRLPNGDEILKVYEARLQYKIKQHLGSVANSAKANITGTDTVRTGLLRESIMVKTTTKKRSTGGKGSANRHVFSMWAGVGCNTKTAGIVNGKLYKPYKIAHLVELGFKHKDAGEISGVGYLQKAVSENGGKKSVDKIIAEELRQSFELGSKK